MSARVMMRGWLVAGSVAGLMAALTLVSYVTSATQVTDRSVSLSSASVASTGVQYTFRFTTTESAGALVIDFCSNSSLAGQTCEPAAGFDASEAEIVTNGFSLQTAASSRVVVSGSVATAEEVELVVAGLTNPGAPGTLYARIVTFEDTSQAAMSTPEQLGGGVIDQGGVAIAITPTIGVLGTVLETMTFCVAATEIGPNCAGADSVSLQLGQEVADGVFALAPGVLHEATMYTQVSTNAINGVVVRLKSSATDCGGLVRAGSPTACDIRPASTQGISPQSDTALFGVRTASATSVVGAEAHGELRPAAGSIYTNDAFVMNFVEGNTSGVTGAYGDPFLDTAGAPANNKNMKLTFGATVASDTPAGDYSAAISLIAVGKF